MATYTRYAVKAGKQVELAARDIEMVHDCGPDAEDHPLEIDGRGTLRFKGDPFIRALADMTDLNGLAVFVKRAEDADDPLDPFAMGIRKFYRDMGYSVCGYLEVFEELLHERYPHWYKS